jgi:hypothetical protein
MQNRCPIPMGTSMWLRVCSELCSPRVQNTGMVAYILTSIISAREDFYSRTDRAAQTFRTTSIDDGDADKDPS